MTTRSNFLKTKLPVYTLALAGFFTIAVFTSYTDLKQETIEKLQHNLVNDNLLAQVVNSVKLGEAYDFAGEPLPMDNFDVRERLERELLRTAYYHSATMLNLKRTTRFFPIIEKILKEKGVPDDIKFLAVAESDLSNATSSVGARGFWQFMKATAPEYGLEVNDEVDERLDLEKATIAACQYLKKYREKFGSWTLAAAAYNEGAGRLSSDMEIQRETDYYHINHNEETSRYVFRIVAMKEILANPKKYGYVVEDDQYYQTLGNFTTVEVSTAIENLGDFAKQHGTSYRMLKLYNPWLTSHKLTNKYRKTYTLKIPRKKF